MAVKKGQTLELDVDTLAFGGKGMVRVDGMAVFIDQAVPGDRVAARIVKKKKRYAEARVLSLLAKSEDRVEPPCPYCGTCGGCKWQFLRYEKQLEYKRRQVEESLAHIGLIHNVPVYETLGSEADFHYRNKMEFSFSDRRWLMPDELGREDIGKDFALGLHVPGTFDKVLDIEACLLQPMDGNRILAEAKRLVRNSGRPPYGLRSHEGFWRFLMLRHSVARDEWMVNMVTSDEDAGVIHQMAGQLLDRFPNIASFVNNVTARKAAIAVGEKEIRISGKPYLVDTIGGHEFEISANSFFQTNTRGAALLYGVVRNFAGLTGEESVLDLYCGTGTIAISLSDSASNVIGLEISESAVADAWNNCRRNGIDNCRFVQGDIIESLAQISKAPDVMIIDPPRVGMHKKVVRQILDMAPKRIVYVSCNPATLARDLGELKARYEVAEAQPVDMFPHTYHVEAVARLQLMAA